MTNNDNYSCGIQYSRNVQNTDRETQHLKHGRAYHLAADPTQQYETQIKDSRVLSELVLTQRVRDSVGKAWTRELPQAWRVASYYALTVLRLMATVILKGTCRTCLWNCEDREPLVGSSRASRRASRDVPFDFGLLFVSLAVKICSAPWTAWLDLDVGAWTPLPGGPTIFSSSAEERIKCLFMPLHLLSQASSTPR
jgi:hypothetical protein